MPASDDIADIQEESKNAAAVILRGVGIFEFAAGALVALIALIAENFVLCGAVLAAAFISGMMFIGFAEIITLLQKIANQQPHNYTC